MFFQTSKLSSAMSLPLPTPLPLGRRHRKPSLSFISSSYSVKPSLVFPRPCCAIRAPDRRPSRPGRRDTSSSSYPWKDKVVNFKNNSSRDIKTESSKERKEEVEDRLETKYVDKGQKAINRIVLRLRNLGLGSDDENEDEEDDEGEEEEEAGVETVVVASEAPLSGEEKLGDLLKRDWIRPDEMLLDEDEAVDDDSVVFPWDRNSGNVEEKSEDSGKVKSKVVKAPTLAEMMIDDEELRRLRRMGMTLRERINVAKAGVTQAVVQKMHDSWRNNELVRLKFHESLAHDMRTAHELVEQRSGGLIIWRAGSVMVVYRGSNYEGPARSQPSIRESVSVFIPDVSTHDKPNLDDVYKASPHSENNTFTMACEDQAERISGEELEYNELLDGLGPRFVDWWGTGVLPVDADLLPPTIAGYKTPYRLLPMGMRSHLTNAEMTNLRKLARKLPCHFALGRNRNHQGLAAAIIKLWEESLVVKIAVKRGIQNTNNKLMAEEIQSLTGGVLLLRNKFYIVIYRGKDFLPTSVAAALAERQELTKQIQDVEEKVRTVSTDVVLSKVYEGHAPVGTLAEFYEAQARWGKEITADECEKMIKDASIAKANQVVRRIEHKLELAQGKMLRAEKLLSKIEASMVPVDPCDDQETITDEERYMFRRLGLKMKAYLPLGIRGVFDGVIENMHLHWKHRELVKLISKQKTLAFVEETARLLEYESGGILVSIDPVPKGYTLIYYRGKNYQRPASIRPRNLLTKAKALKRSVAMQRHEALSQHISNLETAIMDMKLEIGDPKGLDTVGVALEFSQNEHEDSFDFEAEGEDDYNDELDDDAILSRFEGEAFMGKLV